MGLYIHIMKNHPIFKRATLCLFLFACILFTQQVNAQVETIKSGSFIVNMGNPNPGTIDDDVRPYGMMYDLMKNYSIPIKWAIAPGKPKDGVDFIHNGIAYKGGTFIIPSEYRSATINARITYWQTQGVVGNTAVADFTTNIYMTLRSIPKWTLDAQNGKIAEGFLIAAGIDNLGPSADAYNWRAVAALDCCDDFFVMPHADPTWASHNRLYSWNRDCHGSIWAGCHAVSALENCINPANPTQQMNFLSTRTAATTPTPYPNNSLKLWSTHANGSIPYIHRLFDDPVSQYIGVADLSQNNGSEQIFIPKQSTDPGGATRWRPATNIISYDPTQADVPSPDLANGNVAVAIAYGPGFGDNNNGLVMYEAGHNIMKGGPGDGPALRAFFNFSFYQVQLKAPQVTATGLINGEQFTSGNVYNFSASATSVLSGVSFTYQWSSTCGGAFSAPTSAATTFTPTASGSCMITVKVTDNCGRQTYQTFSINVLPPAVAPIAVDDNVTISGTCVPRSPAIINVLANDIPNVSPVTFTSLNQGTASPANAGTWTSNGSGTVTFTPNPNFNGSATITYTVTSAQGLSSNATIRVSVGTVDVNGCFPNSIYAPSEVAFISLDNFISQSGTVAVLGGTAFDDAEELYKNGDDYLNFWTNAANHLILATGSLLPLRAKDTLNIFWSKSTTLTGTMTVQLGQSPTGPWSNAKTFTNAIAAFGVAGRTVSQFIIPSGVSGITHIRVSAGTAPATNSASDVWVDAIEFQYLSCISKSPDLGSDAATVLEDAPAIINVLENDSDPQGLPLRLTRIITQPANGRVSINTDETVTYINNTDNTANESFSYEVCNSQEYCSTATVNIIISVDGCGPGQYRANPSSGAITKVFRYQFVGTNAATANSIGTNFMDSKLYEGSSGNNKYGGSTSITLGKVLLSNATRDIFYFNINEIPVTAIIQSANFSIYRSGGDNNDQLVYLHGLTENFVENQVTWLKRATPSFWNPAAGGSFGASISSTTVTSKRIRYNWDAKSLVQNWVATPANNFGLLLKTGEALNKVHQFSTKENGTLINRPQLTVTYIIPDPCAVIPNRPPLANPDYGTVRNGQTVVISPLTNDGDVDAGSSFTITGVSGITSGTATFTGTTITYTANVTSTVTRTERLSYTITDNNGGSDIAYVYITVTNAPPNANKDLASTLSGTAVSVSVLTNDTDPEGGSLAAPTITSSPKNGAATVIGNNIQYTPGPGFTGKDTLIYQVCESVIGSCSPVILCDTAFVVITVQNQTPVANNDTKTILPCRAKTINLINNDTDPEGNSLAIASLSPLSNPAAGTLVNNNDGTVTFTPAQGYSGVVTFTYTVIDNGITPLTSLPATVTITVNNPVNTAPIAINDAESTNMDHKLYASVLDNDYDPEEQDLTNPVITVQPVHGSAIVLANGLIEYTPNPGFAGSDILTYQICDKVINQAACTTANTLCATATLSIMVTSSNTTIGVNDEHSTWINTPVSGSTLSNDFDLEGNLPLIFRGFIIGGTRYTSGSYTINGTNASGTPVVNAGTLVINAGGTYTFTPANNFAGTVIVSYAIDDSSPITATDEAELQITVTPLPSALNSVIANNDENTSYGPAVTGNVLTNDRDPQGNLFTVSSYNYDNDGDGIFETAGTVGAAVVVGGITTSGLPAANAGTLTLNSNGTYTFTPAADFNGTARISYRICDNNGTVACANAILHIEKLEDQNGAGNDLPVAGDDFIYTRFNIAASGSFINNDADPNGDQLSFNGITIVTGGPHTLMSSAPTNGGGTVQFYADGTYTYTPLTGFSGPDDINYSVCDVTATAPQPLCKSARIHFLVAQNDLPIAVNDVNTTNEDTPVSGNASINDTPSGDGGNVWSLIGVNGGASNGTVTMNTSGGYTYTPAANYNGTDVFTYQVCDVNGDCSTATVTITIIPVDDAPIAVNDENSTWQNVNVNGNVFTNDNNIDNSNPVFGSFLNQTTFGIISSGTIISGIDKTGTTIPNAGTILFDVNGGYTLSPSVTFTGTVKIPYLLCSNGASPKCDTAFLSITVDKYPNVVNSIIANNDENLSYGAVVNSNLLLNDRDPQNHSFAVTGITGGPLGILFTVFGFDPFGNPVTNAGTMRVQSNGNYNYTPAVGFAGSIYMPYTITDVLGATSTAILHIDVLQDLNGPANDPPIAGDDFIYTPFNTPATGNFISNDGEPNNEPVSIFGIQIVPGGLKTPTGLPLTTQKGGTVQFYKDGTYLFTALPGFTGPDYVNYTICDVTAVAPSSLCASAQIHFLVGVPLSTLPANGLKATAALQGNIATIKWETESEQNTAYFEVERSLDNTVFTSTGSRIIAAGNSTTKKGYLMDDNTTGISQYPVIYYRVKLIDVDGNSKYSNTVLVKNQKFVEITGWPNPFKSYVSVNVTVSQPTFLTIRLTDIGGRTIRTKQQETAKGTSQFTITELDNLANGVYLLDITDKISGNKKVIKFIKER